MIEQTEQETNDAEPQEQITEQETIQPEPPEPPQVITLTPPYDPSNPDHVRRWVLAGKPDLSERDGDGNTWGPTITALRQEDGSYQVVPAPAPPELSPIEQLFAQVQAKLDRDEYLRTGKEVDPKGAISRSRAWAATAMLFNGWHYPSEADLSAGNNPALLAAIYADPTTNTTEQSSTAQKRKVLHFTLVMLEGQRFGLQYAAELGAYERTASGQIRAALAVDASDWMELPCGRYATVRAMFLAVLK